MHRGGIDLHFFAALSLVGACMAAMCLLVNFAPADRRARRHRISDRRRCCCSIDMFFAPPTAPLPIEWQIKLHVVFALFGYSVLSIAALLAILLAMQEHALRQRQFGRFVSALPPLTLTEALMFQLIGAGFVLLTLTLFSGILFVENLFAQHLIHKTVLSIAAWLVFGTLLFGRWRYGWRGRRAMRMTLSGMALLLLAYFGTPLRARSRAQTRALIAAQHLLCRIAPCRPRPPTANRRRSSDFHFEGTVKLYSDKAMWESKLVDNFAEGRSHRTAAWNGTAKSDRATAWTCASTPAVIISMGVTAAHIMPHRIGSNGRRSIWTASRNFKRLVEAQPRRSGHPQSRTIGVRLKVLQIHMRRRLGRNDRHRRHVQRPMRAAACSSCSW